MIPIKSLPPEAIRQIFEQDLLNKKMEILGAIWQVVSVNPNKHKISIELIGVMIPKELESKPVW